MPTIQDTLFLDYEDFTLFTPSYSNLKAAAIIDLINAHVSLKGNDKTFFYSKGMDLFEVVLYNCFLTVFAMKLSESDLNELLTHPYIKHIEYRMCDGGRRVPYEYYYKSYVSTLFLEKLCKLNKKNLAIVVKLLFRFLNLNDENSWGNFYDTYKDQYLKHSFETYEDSIKAFRTFLVWFDGELSQAMLAYKQKGVEEFLELQKFIKRMLEDLPGKINLDDEVLPQNYIELIKMYNPEFGELISPQEAPEG